MMTYQESLAFLYSSLPMYQRMGAAAYKNNLDTSLEFDRIHGHPHKKFKTIHIAGTNGKGSVSHMLAAILQKAGYKTGLYTSPHLKDFRERIRINGEMIPESEVVLYLEQNKKFIEQLKPSFFEMTVDLAFLYFEKNAVDIAVIETGMGGRLDSTNIITPLVSVITNIGLDHIRFLGDTLPEIAGEKAGIIKANVPVIIGEYHPETFPVFEKMAFEKKSELHLADKNFRIDLVMMNTDRTIHLKIHDLYHQTLLEIDCDLTGIYQKKNILTVLETLAVLNEIGFRLNINDLKEGFKEVRKNTGLRGRWEETGFNPLIIFDTAHNAEGVAEVIRHLESIPRKDLHIIWAMVSDKNPQKILKLLPTDAMYYFTKADIPRSMNEKILHEMALEFGLKGKHYADSSSALQAAKNHAHPEDVVLVSGSTFLVGELL